MILYKKCSVTENTVFLYVKIIFLLSQKKIIFFTILNLLMVHIMNEIRIHV